MNRWTSSRRGRALAVVAAAVLVLVGCGSDGDGEQDGADAATSPDVTSSAPATASPSASTSPSTGASASATSSTLAATPSSTPSAAAPTSTPRTTEQPAKKREQKVPAPKATKAASPSITVSKTKRLKPGGEVVRVTGRGFDTSKGVYLALCAKAGGMPSNCGGGVNMSAKGDGGASVWISSDPPPYAKPPITIPFKDGGRFSVRLHVSSLLGDGSDCRQTQCYVATRADHTRTSDRSQDVYVPVTFAKR